MIVGACGFGSSGSSVVSDYLKEYDDIVVLDELEFTLVWETDGLLDLENHIMCPNGSTTDSIVAIQRYLELIKRKAHEYQSCGGIPKKELFKSTKSFVDRITDISWKWYSLVETSWFDRLIGKYLFRNRIIPFFEKKLKKRINIYPIKDVRFSMKNNEFFNAAKQHINDLLKLMGVNDSKTIVLDQPFSGNNPQVCLKYFDDAYAIVVDRDPRDMYVFAMTKLMGRNHFIPLENVESFVKYYKLIREHQPYLEPNSRILRLQFEKLVYEYETETKKIRQFLRLPENPNPKAIFDPSLSIANTQVYKRYPEFQNDIKYIEKELKEYLFDFSKYKDIEIKGEMFYGRSNKRRK